MSDRATNEDKAVNVMTYVHELERKLMNAREENLRVREECNVWMSRCVLAFSLARPYPFGVGVGVGILVMSVIWLGVKIWG